MKTAQDMKVERKTLKKTQTVVKLKNEKFRNSSKPLEVNFTNRVGEKEVKISKSGDNIEEIDASAKTK